MFAITQRAPAHRQKSTEVIRGAQARMPWAWDGLCLGVPFAENSLEGYREVVTNITMATSLAAFWTRDGRGNQAVYFNTAQTGYLEYPHNPKHDQPSTALTAYVRVRRMGLGTHAYCGYFTNVYALTDPWSSWTISGGSAFNGCVMGGIAVNGVSYNTADTAIIPTTEYVSMFLRWRSGSTLEITVLGERGQLLTSATSAGSITGAISYASGQPIRVNTSEDLSASADGNYSQVMVWSRRLSDTEMAELTADPFGWYSPRRATVVTSSPYVLPLGGGEMRGGTGYGGWG